MSNDLLDLSVLLKIVQRFPGERAVDFQAIDEGGNGDEAVGLHILLELVGGLLIEDHSVVGLVLDYTYCQWRDSQRLCLVLGGGEIPQQMQRVSMNV